MKVQLPRLIAGIRMLATPVQRWPRRTRLAAGCGAVLLAILRACYSVYQGESVFAMADARFYLGIARSDYSEVMQPFASRQLGALVVRLLVRLVHCTVERGFWIEGACALIVLLAAVYLLVLRTRVPMLLLIAIAIIPFWAMLLQYLVLPDLWFSALLALLLLLLAKKRMLAASLMMFPLMLSRESTSLVLVCFLLACWKQLRWRDRITAVVGSVAGTVVVGHLAARAHSNVEHLPQTVYMLAKVPWNFLHNILGLVPWSNVYPGLCNVPIWSTPLHLGPVQAVGICGFSPSGWEFIAQAILTSFGLLPLLFFYLWRRRVRSATRTPLVRFALLYGSVSLFLAPLLGVWFGHLIGYAWPLFLVALPALFDEVRQGELTDTQTLAAGAFLCVHLLAFWVSYRYLWVPQIVMEMLLWVLGYGLLRVWLVEPQVAPDSVAA